MAIPSSGTLRLRGTIGAEFDYTSTNAQLNKKFGSYAGKAAGAQTKMSDFYGVSAHSVEFVAQGSVGLRAVKDGIVFHPYGSGARAGDLVVVWGYTPWQLGAHGMIRPSDNSIDFRIFYAAGQSQVNTNVIGYYFLHDNTSNAGNWYTNAVYSGNYGRVHYAIFRGASTASKVNAEATRSEDHLGWVAINHTRGNYFDQTAPPAIATLSGYTHSDNYYTGNISGTASNGYNYNHMYSYRMSTQYRLDGLADLPAGASGTFIELKI